MQDETATEAAAEAVAGDAGADEAGAEDGLTDAGLADAGRAPARQCIASRTVRPVGELMRFVVGPDGSVVPDIHARLPGRGAWVTANRPALAEAIKRKAFARAFRGKVRLDPARAEPALADLVGQLLEKDALAALALANKAGRLVTGNAKVIEALQAGNVAVLVHAADAAPDGVAKLDALARRIGEAGGREIARVDGFAGVQLDLALGRSNVVHAALLAHPTSAGFLARMKRLEGWAAG
ncbi:RNA-binding protein [Starkeya koreensis]|uniref:RNA-binding protein n=1 Tax=Ancylobacter koreensis TaxID=266121 RepID=A0ABT0DHY3_9HYPH|nr:RNA-binding protein [Ancylobacter koreensis]